MEHSKLISEFEKIKGYSSNLFDNEEWAEFDAFEAGIKIKEKTVENLKYEISILGLSEEDLTGVNEILEKL